MLREIPSPISCVITTMPLEVLPPAFVNSTLVGFVQQPDGRGTLTVLFSCLLTLSLCVWSAVHLDLPKYNEGSTQYTLRYLKWSLMGIFGPELLIWVAWRQYISARELTKSVKEVSSLQMRRRHPDANHQQSTRRNKESGSAKDWSIVHSFYTGMGGFVFDLDECEIDRDMPYIPELRRLHVTPRGVRLLAQCGLLPEISKDEIEDKSKSDGSAKMICCIQVIWIIVQTITRLAVGLAISPLEINTLGHVACALMMYALWWSKPRWVREPTILRGDWTRAMCAFMYMSSQVSAEQKAKRDLLRNFGVQTELAGMFYTQKSSVAPADHASPCNSMKALPPLPKSAKQAHIVISNDATSLLEDTLARGQLIPRETTRPGSDMLSHKQDHFDEMKPSPERSVTWADLDLEDPRLRDMAIRRWEYCCEALEEYPEIRRRLKYPVRSQEQWRYREALQLYPDMPEAVRALFRGRRQEEEEEVLGVDAGNTEWTCISVELVVDRPRNWPGDDLIMPMQGHLMGAILWFATTIYGAIHLAGWNEHFPTVVESWFWRGSAAYLIFSGLLWSFLNLMGHYSCSVWLYWYELLAGYVKRRTHMLIYVLSVIGGTLYVIARLYLVIEAFVSLRSLPASVYESPSWILSVPHLG